ncbi:MULTISPECIES: MaoC family dehydratase [Frankia]|uniref:MaoC-like domain-containing protein n=2 Tax=Frankia TaxID=1854 RepID=Q0RK22_FRAAA|nr:MULTISPECIES: MaoC family dehydratase [Frankia]EIV91927.1 acyl dehydratase [Frankia sp. QA3]CAJ62138.1 Conserved hypothetical protein (Nodulation protein N-related protein); Thioesterase/thiol ester dehydrase-isomerase domain [Frankia alni ACN14a]
MEIYRSAADLEAALGTEIGPTDWLTVEQSRIDLFADATEDHQWIHVDPERAAGGPYGATIAHGFLTASLVPYFMNKLRTIEGIRMGINYGLDRVRFPSPVRAGARIRARATLIDLRKLDDGAVQVTNRVTIDVDGSAKPGCVVELLARYYFADAAGS